MSRKSAGPPSRSQPGIASWVDGHRHTAIALTLLALAGGQVALLALRGGPLESRWEYLGLAGALGGLGVLVLAAALDPADRVQRLVLELGRRLGRAAWLLWLGLILVLPLLALGPSGRFFQPLWVRAAVLWILVLAGAAFLEPAWPSPGYAVRLITTAVTAGVAYQAATQLPGISSYPLSLAWSEASRYYYASLYLSKRIYGFQAPLSVLHPSRYLLQALPFLLSHLPIWVHRLWQALLWLGLPLLTVGLLARRLRIKTGWERAAYVMWAFLFVFQGPVLYHLPLAAVPVLWGMHSNRFWRTLLWVLIGSIWAGLSRINWFAMAGITAAAIYLLESPRVDRSRWSYWSWPLGWIGLGGLVAVAVNAAYVVLSGNQAAEFGSSFTSDLLWYRLLPNPTLAPGILLAAALISLGPLLVLRSRWKESHPARDSARWLPLAAMLGVLLVGGVVVSVKIGGGSNLHNLDTYLLLLLVVASYAGLGRVAGWPEAGRLRLGWGGWLFLLAVPILFNLKYGGPARPPDRQLGEQVLRQVRGRIAALGPDPQVLLISERQLLTFGELDDLELIPAYEKVFLMEMAMSGTQPYLAEFHAALREQRFDLIVSDPLAVQFQGRARAFGEENDAWVNQVSIPVLCYYEPAWTEDRAAVQILVPREQAPACPDLPSGG
jgi:hypothetical protein